MNVVTTTFLFLFAAVATIVLAVGAQDDQWRYLLTAFLVLSAIFMSTEKVFGLLLLLLPNQRLFAIGEGGVSALNILILTSLIVHVLFRPTVVGIALRSKTLAYSMAFLFLYSLQYAFRYGEFLDAVLVFKFVLMILFAAILLDRANRNPQVFVPFVYLYILGCILAASGGILASGSFVFEERFSSSENASPNSIAAHSAFGIALLFLVWSIRRPGLASAALLILLTIVGFLTQSRTFILAATVCIAVFLVSGNEGRWRRPAAQRWLYIGGIALLMGLLLEVTSLGNVYDSIAERIVNPRNADISNNRFLLWAIYFNEWISSWLVFLVGIGSFAINDRVGVEFVAHNFLLEAAVSYGLLGLFVILLIYWSIWKKFRIPPVSDNGAMGFLPLAIAILTSSAGHGLTGMQFFFQFIVALVAINYVGWWGAQIVNRDRALPETFPVSFVHAVK